MNAPNERVIDRIRKMLALANDRGATEGERDNALRMAHATLAKYNLDLAAIERTPGVKNRKEERRGAQAVAFFGRPWGRAICQAVAEMCFCQYLFIGARQARDVKHYFIGRESNAVTACEVAKFLVNAVMREAQRGARETGGGNPYVRSFGWGAASKIRARVDDLVRASRDQKPEAEVKTGTALVLASVYDQERVENEKALALIFPKTRVHTNQGRGIADGSAFAEGVEYGGKVSLNTQVGHD